MPKLMLRKYPNRKFYIVGSSSYLSLKDIVKLVKENKPFKVVDHRTKLDLTQETLLACIKTHSKLGTNDIIDLVKRLC